MGVEWGIWCMGCSVLDVGCGVYDMGHGVWDMGEEHGIWGTRCEICDLS